MSAAKIRMVPRQAQLRLDELSDDELLGLLRTARDATTDEAAFNARCDLTDLYRTLDNATYLRALDRVRALREQVRAERRPR